MALKRTYQLPSKVTGEYCRISLLSNNYIAHNCECDVSVYKDKEARDEGATPILTRKFLLSSAETRAAAYALLKALPEFHTAEDV